MLFVRLISLRLDINEFPATAFLQTAFRTFFIRGTNLTLIWCAIAI